MTVVGFLPYWFRFAQCINKYREKPLPAHLRNAGKYFASMCVPFVGLWLVKFQYDGVFWTYLAVRVFSTVYSYSWDLYMDWGLIRSREPLKYALRPKITFPRYFYYWAAITNLFLRFFWLIFVWRAFEIMDESESHDLWKEFSI
jgi:xenotropic and polytropic retrovirus receptor 1